MKKNFNVDKSILNFIHSRNFFSEKDAIEYADNISTLDYKFTTTIYGKELTNLNMIQPEMDLIIGSLLGDYVKIDEKNSGIFRLPLNNTIHFEFFNSLNEWRLAVALQDNTFKTYRHVIGYKDAREEHKLDYDCKQDWIVETQINLPAGDAVFYRPWIFHSFEEKYTLNFSILVEG